MKWYHMQLGSHTNVRVYVKGALAGRLCFRNEEFEAIKKQHAPWPMLNSVH